MKALFLFFYILSASSTYANSKSLKQRKVAEQESIYLQCELIEINRSSNSKTAVMSFPIRTPEIEEKLIFSHSIRRLDLRLILSKNGTFDVLINKYEHKNPVAQIKQQIDYQSIDSAGSSVQLTLVNTDKSLQAKTSYQLVCRN